MKKGLIISILLNVILLALVAYVTCIKTDYAKRVWAHCIGDVYVPVRVDADCVNSWNTCINQLNLDVDVAFFGNSITCGGHWQDAFPNLRVINLGYIGEDAKGMLRRVEQISSVHPEKVFIMAGINGLRLQSQSQFEQVYAALIDSVQNALPNAKIYLESLLPVSRSSVFCPNAKIVAANDFIRHYAASHDYTYIDVYSLYAVDEVLPDNLTYDGLHLTSEAYQCWYDLLQTYLND